MQIINTVKWGVWLNENSEDYNKEKERSDKENPAVVFSLFAISRKLILTELKQIRSNWNHRRHDLYYFVSDCNGKD